jgi:hypothetical protein
MGCRVVTTVPVCRVQVKQVLKNIPNIPVPLVSVVDPKLFFYPDPIFL